MTTPLSMMTLTYKFVEFIPDTIEEGVLYISMSYGIVTHKCCCGCQNEVVTPLSPTDWSLLFDGETVTLDPSVGSWSLDCQSHYFIKKNQVRWAASYTYSEISKVRSIDTEDKLKFYEGETQTRDKLPFSEDSKKISPKAANIQSRSSLVLNWVLKLLRIKR